MSASASFFGFGKDSWKEEVLLHNGQKLIVERSQSYGGRHEIGQPPPIKEWSITFTLPNSNKPITWKTEFSEDIGSASLILLALDVVKGVPYIVTTTAGCLAYNKWGRPSPPYVIFKYDHNAWQRISLAEFPAEIKEANVVGDTQTHGKELAKHAGVVTAKEVDQINGFYSQDVLYLKVFVRSPLSENCPVLVPIKGGWGSPGGAKAPGGPFLISPPKPSGEKSKN